MATALERIQSLIDGQRLEPWHIRQLAALGHEAKTRWLAVRERLGLDVSFAGDGVALLDPEFTLPSELEERVEKALPGTSGPVAIRFLKWATFPKTSDFENPFEPLIEIMEHGGSSRPEHGMFLDIIDFEGATCGVVLFR